MKKAIISLTSSHTVAETVHHLKTHLQEKGIQLIAQIDHAKAAHENGLSLRDEVLLIFGDPKVGTYLMQEQPEIGIELPLKFLVWQGVDQKTYITYKDPLQLSKHYDIKKQQPILEKMHDLLGKLAEESV